MGAKVTRSRSMTQTTGIPRSSEPRRRRRANSTSPRAATRRQIVRCIRCRTLLQPPAGHERFRCRCGQLMRNPYMIERERCPQCRGVLAPPPGLQRFRCPCGAVLALPGGPMWRCNVCNHTNPTHRSTCEMCGTWCSSRENFKLHSSNTHKLYYSSLYYEYSFVHSNVTLEHYEHQHLHRYTERCETLGRECELRYETSQAFETGSEKLDQAHG